MTDIAFSESQGLALAAYIDAAVKAAVNEQVAAVLRSAISPKQVTHEDALRIMFERLDIPQPATAQPEPPKATGRGTIMLDLDDPATREALLDVEIEVLSTVADRMAMAARRRTEGAPMGWKDTIVTKAAGQ